MRSKARVLGTCYVCGERCWGRRTTTPDHPMRGGTVRDTEGIRHEKCSPRRSGLGEILET